MSRVQIKYSYPPILVNQQEDYKNECSTITIKKETRNSPSSDRHSVNKKHEHVNNENFEVLGEHYSWWQKRKIAEALLIKEQRPDLNEQGQSVPLKLLN